MTSLMRLSEVTEEKQSRLVKDFVDERVVGKIDDIGKLSVTHLTQGFQQYILDRFDLPFKVSSVGFLNRVEKYMNEIGYEYAGKSSKLRFIQMNREKYQLDKVLDALNISHIDFLIESHRYFEKLN